MKVEAISTMQVPAGIKVTEEKNTEERYDEGGGALANFATLGILRSYSI